MMPEMDGKVALVRIRAKEEEMGIHRRNRAQVIMVTALEDMKTIMSSYYLLCDSYVMKPVEQEQLLEQIRLLGFSV
jgi:DNA-binding response OmpR family regulator